MIVFQILLEATDSHDDGYLHNERQKSKENPDRPDVDVPPSVKNEPNGEHAAEEVQKDLHYVCLTEHQGESHHHE